MGAHPPSAPTATVILSRYTVARHSVAFRFPGFWQAPKSTRKRNTPENAGNRPFPESAFSGVLRFRVCFGVLLEGNKEHPKTQHTRKRRFWKQSITCVFGCVAFSGALCSPLNRIGGASQENRDTRPEKGPVAPPFSALEGGVALQVASWKVSRYKGGVAQRHCRLSRYNGSVGHLATHHNKKQE